MKVLFADALSESAVCALREMGCEITINADLKAEDLAGAIGDHEILVVRSTKVNAAAINSAPNLALIIRAGAGVNTIDLDEASAHGITVANCPGKNTDAVAELAMGLLVAADRRIHAACTDLLSGEWKKKEYGKSHGLKGRVLGVLGLGSIGRSVAAKAASSSAMPGVSAPRNSRIRTALSCASGYSEVESMAIVLSAKGIRSTFSCDLNLLRVLAHPLPSSTAMPTKRIDRVAT